MSDKPLDMDNPTPEVWAREYAIERLGENAPEASILYTSDTFLAGYLMGFMIANKAPRLKSISTLTRDDGLERRRGDRRKGG